MFLQTIFLHNLRRFLTNLLPTFSHKQLEIDDPNELELDNLLSELHPKKILPKQMFDKPKAPAKARGPRRLVKNGDEA